MVWEKSTFAKLKNKTIIFYFAYLDIPYNITPMLCVSKYNFFKYDENNDGLRIFSLLRAAVPILYVHTLPQTQKNELAHP